MSAPVQSAPEASAQISLPNEQVSPKKSLFNSIGLEQLAKGTAVFAALLYALGLLVSNESLLALDIPDFSAFRPKFLLTGSWTLLFLLITSLPIWPPVMLLFRGNRAHTFQDWLKLALGMLTGIGLVVGGLPYLFSASHMGPWPSFWKILPLIAWACLCMFCAGTVLGLVGRTPSRIFLSFFFLASLLAFTDEFSLAFYPLIPQGLGGGRPTLATLILNKEGMRVWKHIGWESVSSDDESVRTGPVLILHQTDQELWLLKVNRQERRPDSPEWIAVQKSLISAIACSCSSTLTTPQLKK